MIHSSPQTPEVLLTSAGRGWNDFEASLIHVQRGLFHAPGGDAHGLGIHLGPPVDAECRCDGQRVRRVQKAGDIDIVPAGVEGSWEDSADCHILALSIQPSRLRQVAEELGRDADSALLRPRLQVRDARIEAIAWAVKADLEAATPSDPIFIEFLANALAVRLIEIAGGSVPCSDLPRQPRLSSRQLRTLIDFIETNLDRKLRLADLAALIGVSVTRLKTLFPNSTGVPVHQYVIRRRVQHARALMTTTGMPLSEIAVAAGFAHQGHMTTTMRRILGQTPGEIVRSASEFRLIRSASA